MAHQTQPYPMPIEELAKKYQLETQATLMLNALLEVLENIGMGNQPDSADCGICRNASDAVYGAGAEARIVGHIEDLGQVRALHFTAKDAMVQTEIWIQNQAKHWDSPNYSGYPKFPIRCPKDMEPEEEPFICASESKYEDELAAALARGAYYKASVLTTKGMYDQTTEYGRARAEFARYLAGKLRELLGL